MPAPDFSQQAIQRDTGKPTLGWLRRSSCIGLGLLFASLGASGTQNAVANGDNRTITIYHTHTKETTTVTFRRDGSYDREALRKLNWALRDWRRDEQIDMDPRLFDVIWQVTREISTSEPLHVVSAYRSPQTNAALRRRSRGVAQQSQHMVGKAIDFYLPDADMARVRATAMRLQHGGVGFYPGAFNPFVHLDVGSVRSWPRMPRAQLARLFPDGKTVHLPADGKPLEGYEVAKAEILSRGGAVAGVAYAEAGERTPTSTGRSFWATLFGGADEDEDNAEAGQTRGRATARRGGSAPQVAAANAPSIPTNDAGIYSFVNAANQPAPAPAARTRPAPAQIAAVEPPPVPTPLVPAAPPSAIVQAPATAGSAVVAGSAQAFAPLPPVRNQVLALSDAPNRAAPLPPRRAAGSTLASSSPASASPGSSSPLGQPVDGGALAALAAAATAPAPAAPGMVMAYAPMPPMRASLPATAEAPAQTSRQAPAPARTVSDARGELRALFATAVREVAPRRAARVANAKVRTAELQGAVTVPGTILATRFATGTPAASTSTRFSGPAVQPVPVTSLTRN